MNKRFGMYTDACVFSNHREIFAQVECLAKFRDRIPLYWSHFASYRGAWPEIVGAKPQSTYEEWADGARDVAAVGEKEQHGEQDQVDGHGVRCR